MSNFNFIKKMDKWAGIPLIYTLGFFKKFNKKELPKNPKKILLIKLGNLGDAILTIPAIRELKRNYPKSKIYMLTSSRTAGVYTYVKYINKIIDFNFQEKGKFSSFKNIPTIIKIIKQLKKKNFDLVIDLETYSRVTPLLAHLLKSGFIIGFDSNQQKRESLFDERIKYETEKHQVECFFDLFSPLNIKIKNKELEFKIPRDASVDKFFKKNKLSKKDFIVVVHPGNNKDWKIKRWPKERFSEIISLLEKKYNSKVIIIGNKEELDLVKEVKNLSKTNSITCAGCFNIPQLAYLIKKSNLYIGNETGPMHIAAAVKTPVIAIFGPANHIKWGPYGDNNVVVRKELECSPCQNLEKLDRNSKCQEPLKCVNQIRVRNVMKAVDKVLKSDGGYER